MNPTHDFNRNRLAWRRAMLSRSDGRLLSDAKGPFRLERHELIHAERPGDPPSSQRNAHRRLLGFSHTIRVYKEDYAEGRRHSQGGEVSCQVHAR